MISHELFVSGNVPTAQLPPLTSHTQVTDAYFVEVARRHRLKLATLDAGLTKQKWAEGVAENPLLGPEKTPDRKNTA